MRLASAYYNEHDRQKAAWLRHLIEEGCIAHGVVDERPIQAVQADDLAGYAQCHFFAGVGVWSYALRLAGWPDDEPVWTGSCPCGPFSRAGKQEGFADPRHLWPAWLPLIRERRPDRIFGEQSDAADAWIDLVSADLEDLGYAIGSPDIPAAGFRGAHIRQRFYWVADANDTERWAERAPWNDGEWPKTGRVQGDSDSAERRTVIRLADADGRFSRDGGLQPSGQYGQFSQDGGSRGMGDTPTWRQSRGIWECRSPQWPAESAGGRSAIDGADWLWCTDQRWRPIEPGTSPLAHAHPARMGLLRGFGDAIDAETAANFVGAYMEASGRQTVEQAA